MFSTTGKTREIKQHITCKSNNLTYMIECKKCKKHYIRETKRSLRERFTELRQATNNSDHASASAAVPTHFNLPSQSVKDMPNASCGLPSFTWSYAIYWFAPRLKVPKVIHSAILLTLSVAIRDTAVSLALTSMTVEPPTRSAPRVRHGRSNNTSLANQPILLIWLNVKNVKNNTFSIFQFPIMHCVLGGKQKSKMAG